MADITATEPPGQSSLVPQRVRTGPESRDPRVPIVIPDRIISIGTPREAGGSVEPIEVGTPGPIFHLSNPSIVTIVRGVLAGGLRVVGLGEDKNYYGGDSSTGRANVRLSV